MARLDSRIGLQLNGYETIRAHLAGQSNCICCTCCDRTRAEYFVMQDGTLWCVTIDGTIGMMSPRQDTFQIKYHARNYFSWRFASIKAQTFYKAPVSPPNVDNPGFRGSIMFPFFRDLIGFQTDVDKCVIFNNEGDQLYEGYYDGRRFPLMYNGESNTGREHSKFYYATTPVLHPIINNQTDERWGPAARIRVTAETPEWARGRRMEEDTAFSCGDDKRWVHSRGSLSGGNLSTSYVPNEYKKGATLPAEETRVLYDQLGIGFTAVSWSSVFEQERSDLKFCGYETATDYIRYSTSIDYACTCDEVDKTVPQGEIYEPDPIPVMPRGRVKEPKCRPQPCDFTGMQEVFLCEDVEVTKYHQCEATFPPGLELAQQIQGFDLSLCGNFIRVVYRSASVQSNKWYRYVGNAPTPEHLPVHIPKGFKLTENSLQALLDTLPDAPGMYDQDDWGVPKWWSRFLQTYYIYGSHKSANSQWYIYEGQSRKEIPNVQNLKVAGTYADDERQALCDANPEDRQNCTPFCSPGSAEKSIPRTIAGITPPIHWDQWFKPKKAQEGDPVGETTDGDNTDGYSEYYGIQRLDVISVGSGTSDSNKEWYYFDGYAWVKGNGSYMDLKHMGSEDLGLVFYKGLKRLNQCSEHVHMIPASLEKLSCCGDYLLVGLNTDFETRMIFYRETMLEKWELISRPSSDFYSQESFACCPSFFAYSMLQSQTSFQSKFYDIKMDSEGYVTSQKEVWSATFDGTEEPPPEFVNSCSPACRYYFARQNDKKGQYFYRSYENGKYGTWRHMKSLNILNDNNVAPNSGCASTSHLCYIPCEGADDPAGVSEWYKGSQRPGCMWPESITNCADGGGSVGCEGIASCSGVASNGWQSCGQWTEQGSASASLTYVHCKTYSQPPIICGQGGLRFSSEGVTVTSETNAAWSDTGDCNKQSTIGHVTSLSSSLCYAAESIAADDADGHLAACENTLYSLDDYGAVIDSITVPGHTLSPGDATNVGVKWWLGWTHNCTGDCNAGCSLCSGSEDYDLHLPCTSYSISNVCDSQTWSKTYGPCPGGLCTGDVWEARTHCANVGTFNSTITHSEQTRTSGLMFARDKNTGMLRSCDSGMGGTFITSYRVNSGGNNNGDECVYSDSFVPACFMGKKWTAIFEEYSDTIALYRFGNLGDDDAFVCETAFTAGKRDNNHLYKVERMPPTTPGGPQDCKDTQYGCCTGGGTTCGDNFVLQYKDNSVVVDLLWKNRAYRFIIENVDITDSVNCSVGTKFKYKCCGPYALLDNKFYYLDTQIEGAYDSSWSFAECCEDGTGECAVIYNASGVQEVYIEGVNVTSSVFSGDPYSGSVVNNRDEYPVTVQSAKNYYLVNCHKDNTFEWHRRYNPDDWVTTVKEAATPVVGAEPPPFDYETYEAAIIDWRERGLAALTLLDGSECVVEEVMYQKLKRDDPAGEVRIGPKTWRVDSPNLSRPSVMQGQREVYPEVAGLIFRDPMAPWWGEGRTGEWKEEIQADSNEGVMSLMRTLMGVNVSHKTNYETDPVMILRKRIEAIKTKIANNERLMYIKSIEASAMEYAFGMQGFIDSCIILIKFLEEFNADLYKRQMNLERELALLLSQPPTYEPEDPEEDDYISNGWPFGFRVVPGKNIATAFYCKEGSKNPQLIGRDSRLKTVNSYCDGSFGVFYFTGAGYYWWDLPIIERAHTCTEEMNVGAVPGEAVYRTYKSHFDLYMGIPNPLDQYDLYQEQPATGENWQQMGNWLNKYQPYGVYVFNGATRVSDSLDTDSGDDIEPPTPNPLPSLTDRIKPPYNHGWRDPKHPYGGFLYTNDRNAPVRYDRALSWDKPFEDNCNHDCFQLKNSTQYLRSAVAEGGRRMVFGGNGVLHVFDGRLGRMDFNAETLDKIE